MKYNAYRLVVIRSLLGGLSQDEQHRLLGKSEAEIDDAHALRIHRRLARRSGDGKSMSLGDLVAAQGRRRRAMVTHPHKRGRA